jgi:hypothetical protein
MINRFLKLPKGILRLAIFGYIIWWVLAFIGLGDAVYYVTKSNPLTTIIIIFGYWITLRLIIWVYDGFIETPPKNKIE